MLDLAIIGGGPAALSAAIYAARAGLSVKLFEKAEFGGVLPTIPRIENYPGFLGEGKILADAMREQAVQAGASLEYGECSSIEVTATSSAHASSDAHIFTLTVDGEPVAARSVLVASGSEPKRLDFELAIPVSYCALCDGALARRRRVVVVGGANSALQEAFYLAALASEVTIVTHSQIKADVELVSRLTNYPNIKVIEHLEPTADFLNQFDFCFVYIGKLPATGCLQHLAAQYALLDRSGYVCADTSNRQYPHQTVLGGLFAAGDVRQGITRQAVVASADGAEAAIEITNWLKLHSV